MARLCQSKKTDPASNPDLLQILLVYNGRVNCYILVIVPEAKVDLYAALRAVLIFGQELGLPEAVVLRTQPYFKIIIGQTELQEGVHQVGAHLQKEQLLPVHFLFTLIL